MADIYLSALPPWTDTIELHRDGSAFGLVDEIEPEASLTLTDLDPGQYKLVGPVTVHKDSGWPPRCDQLAEGVCSDVTEVRVLRFRIE